MVGMGSINGWAAGAATTALGLHQYYKGKRMRDKNKRPTYEIPQEIQQNLSQAQQMALQGIPEEQKQQYLTNLQRGSAQALASSGSRRGGLAGIAGINQQQNDAYGNLMSMDAQARFQNQGVLMGQRQAMADYRDQAFQVNKMNPYYEKEAEGLAMQGAGQQNIGNSFQIAQGKGGTEGSDNPYNNGKQGQGGQGQMTSEYWNQKSQNGGMKNYNSNSYNGFGDYNYDGGTQYGGYG
jgi:hypothetical protein